MALQIETYDNETEYTIKISNVQTTADRERIRRVIAAFNGVQNEYTEYFYDINNIEEETVEELIEESVGTLYLIPEGIYKDSTIQDAYERNGHYALSYIMLNCLHMKSIKREERESLLEEAIRFALPRIRRRDISFSTFLEVYGKFIANKTPGPEKELRDWLEYPENEQEIVYRELVEHMAERMENQLKKGQEQ